MVLISFLATMPSPPWESSRASTCFTGIGFSAAAVMTWVSTVVANPWILSAAKATLRSAGLSMTTISTSSPCFWKNPFSLARYRGAYPSQVDMPSLIGSAPKDRPGEQKHDAKDPYHPALLHSFSFLEFRWQNRAESFHKWVGKSTDLSPVRSSQNVFRTGHFSFATVGGVFAWATQTPLKQLTKPL